MATSFYVNMMGEFVIRTQEREIGSLVTKSRKGVALMEYLILNYGKDVPKQRILNVLWTHDLHVNPESALKTLVSRLRKLLNAEWEGLGNCIVSNRGSYCWKNLPGMKVDLLELMDLFEALPKETDPQTKRSLYAQMMRLYQGDLFLTGDIEGGASYEAALHSEYLNAVYDYVELLRVAGEYDSIVTVCRQAGRIDRFDDRIRLEMMQALVDANRTDEAMAQYQQASALSARYMDAPLSEEMQDFYQQMTRSSDTLKSNLDFVRTDLREGDIRRGAYICDYQTFKDFCRLERFNLERLGCTLFLGLIMLYGQENRNAVLPPRKEQAVSTLMDVLGENLRKGDVIVRYAPTIVVVLLPTVNHTTGNMIMERVRQRFQSRISDPEIPFHYRLEELV